MVRLGRWFNKVVIAGAVLVVAACSAPPESEPPAPEPASEPAQVEDYPSATRQPPASSPSVTVHGDPDADTSGMGEPDGVIMQEPDMPAPAPAPAAAPTYSPPASEDQARREAMERARAEQARRRSEQQQRRYDESAIKARAAYEAELAQRGEDADQQEALLTADWVVGKYDQNDGFLSNIPELMDDPTDWGQVLTDLIVAALENRSQTSAGMDKKASREELQELAKAGVTYYCDGALDHFAIIRDQDANIARAQLDALYKLRRSFNERFLTVQRELLDVSVQAQADTASDVLLHKSLNMMAVTIANRIVSDVPADLAAIIN